MADRYISRDWLLHIIAQYKDLKLWNTDICVPDTILRVLEVFENIVSAAPSIGPRKYARELVEAQRDALRWHYNFLIARQTSDEDAERLAETLGNAMQMGFYKGRLFIEAEVLDWLGRMVRFDEAPTERRESQ